MEGKGSAKPPGGLHWGGLPNPGGSASKRVCPTPGGGGLHPGVSAQPWGSAQPGGSASSGVCPTQGVCIGGSAWGVCIQGVCPPPGGVCPPNLGGLPNPQGRSASRGAAQPRRGLHWGSLSRGSASGVVCPTPQVCLWGVWTDPPHPLRTE